MGRVVVLLSSAALVQAEPLPRILEDAAGRPIRVPNACGSSCAVFPAVSCSSSCLQVGERILRDFQNDLDCPLGCKVSTYDLARLHQLAPACKQIHSLDAQTSAAGAKASLQTTTPRSWSCASDCSRTLHLPSRTFQSSYYFLSLGERCEGLFCFIFRFSASVIAGSAGRQVCVVFLRLPQLTWLYVGHGEHRGDHTTGRMGPTECSGIFEVSKSGFEGVCVWVSIGLIHCATFQEPDQIGAASASAIF